MQYQRLFLFLIPFIFLKIIIKKCVQCRVTIPQEEQTWIGDQIRIPRVVMTFSSLPFPRWYLGAAKLPFLCTVVSSSYRLFVPHVAMAVLHYRINKQRDTSFEFSSILSTVDLSKHLITAWIIRKLIQLFNFVTNNNVNYVSFLLRQLSMVLKSCMSGHWREMRDFFNYR